MKNIEHLMTILSILDNFWVEITSKLTEEQTQYLKTELSILENKLKETKKIDEMNEIARDYYLVFSKIEPLKFIVDIQKTQMRGGDAPTLEEELKMKLINYTVKFQERLENGIESKTESELSLQS
jgi:hypothetical protein